MEKWYLSLFVFFSFVLVVKGQNESKLVFLVDYLTQISKQHEVSFNYLEVDISDTKLQPLSDNATLSAALYAIPQQTNLDFKFITPRYISIFKKEKNNQNICGFLKNSITNDAIADATIFIQNTQIFVVSNESGFFKIPISSQENQVLEISHLNYDLKIINVKDLHPTNCKNIILNEKTTFLENVSVQTFLTEGISKKNNGSFEIQPKKMGLLPGMIEPDVFLTMTQIPGVNSIDENINNLSVRGGTNDQNLILWNGIRIYQTAHFYGLISALNPNLSNKITIYKNGTPALYSEGISSTILIDTHNDSIGKTSGGIGINFTNVNFNTNIKINKNATLEFSGRRSTTDLYESPTNHQYNEKIFQNILINNLENGQNTNVNLDQKFHFYDFTAHYHQKMKNNSHLYIDFLNISNELQINQSSIESNEILRAASFLEQSTNGLSLFYNKNWNNKWSTQLTSFASEYNLRTNESRLDGTQFLNQENKIFDTGFNFQNSFVWSKNFTTSGSYQFKEIGITNIDAVNIPAFSRIIKKVLKSHAVISEVKYRSNDQRFNATLGLRYNYIPKLNTQFYEPRIVLNYKINSYFKIAFLNEKKHQTANQIIDLQQDFLGIEKRRWILSDNQDFPIVKSNQHSLEFTYSKNNWLITNDYFFKKVNGITSMSQGFQNQFELLRTSGSYQVLGTELLIQKQTAFFTTWLSYTFQDNQYKFPTFNPSIFSNNFEVKHSIKAAIILKPKNSEISLGTLWFSGMPTTDLSSNTPGIDENQNAFIQYQNPNNARLGGFLQTNFSAAHNFKFDNQTNLKIGVSIQNLFNTNVKTNQYFRINNDSNQVEAINTYSLERSYNVFLRYNF